MARFVRCPECGEEIEPHELHWTRRPGDWTLSRGLRSAARFLILRGLIAAAVLIVSILFLEWLGAALGQTVPGFQYRLFTIVVIQLPFGIVMGYLVGKGLEDAAGFTSMLLPLSAASTVLIIAVAVRAFLPHVLALTYAPLSAAIAMASIVAAGLSIIAYLRETVG